MSKNVNVTLWIKIAISVLSAIAGALGVTVVS